MSEYQYYEFQAIDRPLSREQQAETASLSSRAQVNARSASFVYNYGSFRGDEDALVWAYFDAMLYMSNWGDLVAAAAQASPPLPEAAPTPPMAQVEAALDTLLSSAKIRLLEAAQQGKLADIEIPLGRELRAALHETPPSVPGGRTVADLRQLAKAAAAQRAEAKRQQQEAQRLRELEALAKREPQVWQEIEKLTERKNASAYDQAVALLCRLRDLAQQRGETINARPALLARLREQGFMN